MRSITMYGNEFKNLRKNTLRLKQAEIGKIVGVHFTTISDWERENRQIPRCAALVMRLMEADLALREKVIKMECV